MGARTIMRGRVSVRVRIRNQIEYVSVRVRVRNQIEYVSVRVRIGN